MDGLKLSSINELLSKLHNAITQFVLDVKDLADSNERVSLAEIKEIRDRIRERLNSGEGDSVENAKLLKLLNLFIEDKTFIELTREDAEEWLKFMEAIEANVAKGDARLSQKEKEELKEIHQLTGEIKALIRK
ncbi:hypothetical protein M1373_02550 [Candidatus Marsarchaeota archaeon]|nr:hypothetical protein [Candidatus Marsarchaeota archaeon]MCL5404684.1 hypothetical protein [Candidatus Marsarchaeota archaeon]